MRSIKHFLTTFCIFCVCFLNAQEQISAEVFLRPGTNNQMLMTQGGKSTWVTTPLPTITTTLINNWNTAFGWGNHANSGYLTTEVDGSITNEIELPLGGNVGDVLSTNGFGIYSWTPPSTGAVDGVITNSVFSGTNTKTLTISRSNGLSNLTSSFTDRVLTQAQVDAYVANNGYLTAHPNTSDLSGIYGGSSSVIQGLTVDGNGHITSLSIGNFSGGGTNLATNNLTQNLEPRTYNMSDDLTFIGQGDFTVFNNNDIWLAGGKELTFQSGATSDLFLLPRGATGDLGQVLHTDGTGAVYWANDDTGGSGGSADGVSTSSSFSGTNTKTLTITRSSGLPNLIASFTDRVLTQAQVDGFVANNGYLTTEVDGSTTNEIELPLGGNNGDILSTNGAGIYSWITPSVGGVTDGVVTGGTVSGTSTKTLTLNRSNGLPNVTSSWIDRVLTQAQVDSYVSNNGYLTSEVDGSTTNEIELPSGGNNGDILSTNGAGTYSWITPAAGSTSDGVSTTSSFSGTNTKTLTIARSNGLPNITASFTDRVLTEAQVDAHVSNNGFLTSETDGSTTNELQKLFDNVKVYATPGAIASTTVSAANFSDALQLKAGTNITLTPNAANRSVTINSSGGGYTHWVAESLDNFVSKNMTNLTTLSFDGTNGIAANMSAGGVLTIDGSGISGQHMMNTNLSGTANRLHSTSGNFLIRSNSNDNYFTMNSSEFSIVRSAGNIGGLYVTNTGTNLRFKNRSSTSTATFNVTQSGTTNNYNFNDVKLYSSEAAANADSTLLPGSIYQLTSGDQLYRKK